MAMEGIVVEEIMKNGDMSRENIIIIRALILISVLMLTIIIRKQNYRQV